MEEKENSGSAHKPLGNAIEWFLGKMMKVAAKQSGSAADKRISKNDFPWLSGLGDVSGSHLSFYADKDGNISITPRQSRRNVYRDAFLLNGRSEAEADLAADRDLEMAHRARYRNLVQEGYGKRLGPFDGTLNYALGTHPTAIIPHPSQTNGRWASLVYGRVDDPIPLYETDPRGRSEVVGSIRPSRSSHMKPGQNEIPLNGGFERISLNPNNEDVGKYTVLHEGAHSAAHPIFSTGSKGGSTFLDRDKNATGKGQNYAVDPAEMAVAVLHEKALMRALGRHMSRGLGREWEREILGNWSKYGKYSSREMDTNVYSLRRMLYDLSTKANSKRATREDKKRYQDFLDRMDYEFEQVFDRFKNQQKGNLTQDDRRVIA